jgi:HEAT repeat protein
MAFYDLDKEQRALLVASISSDLFTAFELAQDTILLNYMSDSDTYIRKAVYIAIGRIYEQLQPMQEKILITLNRFLQNDDFYIRQTVINALGEIGKKHFELVQHFFEMALFDPHHAVRNAVIGSIKKMAEGNPKSVLRWAETYLEHPDPEIRREICHGIELRGRKHPEDILPLLQRLEWDKKARVRTTLVHVLGQIAYKKGCLAIVIAHLQQWENQNLVQDALHEIVSVHHRYRNFTALSQSEAKSYISFQGLRLDN